MDNCEEVSERMLIIIYYAHDCMVRIYSRIIHIAYTKFLKKYIFVGLVKQKK